MIDITEPQKKPYWLYILKLEQDKYYIGITAHRDPQTRINQHKSGYYSSKWVKKYPYLQTLEIIDIGRISKSDAETLEQKHTLEYMGKFGYNNVRGGTLTYHGKYLKLGDRYYTGENAANIAVVLFLSFSVLILLIKLI
jgi:predicted GIY-YIG superfamily endonuclease